jgi:hypothetical protein
VPAPWSLLDFVVFEGAFWEPEEKLSGRIATLDSAASTTHDFMTRMIADEGSRTR